MSTARPPTILCVDDESIALALRQRVLEKAGYTVVPAANAATALELFESQTVDLVISDHLLPDLSGAELTREMKRSRPFVPIMLFSAVAEVPQGAEHADLFVSKTGGPAELLEKIADLLRCNRISEGNYFAEIRCDRRCEPNIWHYTIQRMRLPEIVFWCQAGTETAAVEAAKSEMRHLNQRDRAGKTH